MASNPKFQWSKSKRRYMNGGRVVSDQKVRDWAQSAIDTAKERIASITQDLIDGKITGAAWVKAMKAEIAAAHEAMIKLANGGKLDADAEKRLAEIVKAQ